VYFVIRSAYYLIMKLIASSEKVIIKWFVWNGGKRYDRNNEIKWGQGYDFGCSCGYESNFGAAPLKTIQNAIWDHKFYDHDYKIK
jgi:hypothetical protein